MARAGYNLVGLQLERAWPAPLRGMDLTMEAMESHRKGDSKQGCDGVRCKTKVRDRVSWTGTVALGLRAGRARHENHFGGERQDLVP